MIFLGRECLSSAISGGASIRGQLIIHHSHKSVYRAGLLLKRLRLASSTTPLRGHSIAMFLDSLQAETFELEHSSGARKRTKIVVPSCHGMANG